MSKYYAIRTGHQSGVVVNTWEQCKALTDGCKGAVFKSFKSYQKNEAEQFAKHGKKRNQTPKKVKPSGKTNPPITWNTKLYPCVERVDYTDTLTGVRYKHRCIRRKGPTVRGKDFKPHIGNSVPW